MHIKKGYRDFFKNGGWEIVDLEIPKAMANILAELEQMLKEREKHTIRLTDEEYRRVIDIAQKDIAEQKDKRIQELEEENSKTQIMSPYYVKENYIPKQVIIDKIEELKNNLKYIDCNRDCGKCFDKEGKALYRGSNFMPCFAYHQIKILQELLKESEDK